MNNNLIVNEAINYDKLLVIDNNGKNLGLVTKKEALSLASDAGLDLILINGGDDKRPPIAKIIDKGKYLYEQKIKIKSAAQQKNQFKQITVNVTIADNDLSTKAKQVTSWLNEGSQVLFRVKATGRAASLKDLINSVFDKFFVLLNNNAKIIVPFKQLSPIYYAATLAKNK